MLCLYYYIILYYIILYYIILYYIILYWSDSNNMVCFLKWLKTVRVYVVITVCVQTSVVPWSRWMPSLYGVWQQTTQRVCLLWTGVLLCVSKKRWCQLPEDGKINSAETCSRCATDCAHKWQNSALAGVTWPAYCIITDGINKAE